MPDSRPIKGSCFTDFIGSESDTLEGALKMVLKINANWWGSFPNECDLVCPRKLIYSQLDAQFHTFKSSHEYSGLDLQLACIRTMPLRSICL